MSRRSGGISLATIIFWAILASTFLFDDDDKKPIEIKTDVEVVETSKSEELVDHLKGAVNIAKEALVEAKDKTIEIIDEYEEEQKNKKEITEVDQAHNNKTIETETIEKQEEKVDQKETIKPLEENKPQQIEGMKKL